MKPFLLVAFAGTVAVTGAAAGFDIMHWLEILAGQGVLGVVTVVLYRDWQARGRQISDLNDALLTKTDDAGIALLAKQGEVIQENVESRKAIEGLTLAINTLAQRGPYR